MRCLWETLVRAIAAHEVRRVFLLLWLVFTAAVAAAAEPKRVLIVHSFGTATPPFTVHSTAFENALVQNMGERVDLDEVSLDMARYSDPDMQDALVDYLEKRKAKWQADLVVPIGSPAGIFIAKYRDRLFPDTPILYTSLDRRLLPEGALANNAAYVGQIFNLEGLIEDMLQVAPETKNIAVVVGATPLEQYWKEAFRKTIVQLAPRIQVTYFDNLSFDQMLRRAATLPPHSYIFMLLLLRDAAGVTYNADEALEKLHAAANAPINSIFDHQMGLGIVGGRLYQSERIGKEAAEIATRILHGEPASSFSPKLIEPLSPRYDWRELRRWKIDEKHLPPGSTILFRVPTVWEQYRGWIIAGVALLTAETLLIAALLANLVKRRRAEGSLMESETRFGRMADAAPMMVWMSGPDKLCTFFNKAWLDFTGRKMEEELGDQWSKGVHPDDLGDCLATYTRAFDARQPFSMQYRLRRHDGEYRSINDEGVPRYDATGNFIGYVGACIDVSDVLQKDRELRESEERITLAAEAAHLGVWELNTTTNQVWMSDQARKLFQFEPRAEIDYSTFCNRVHPDDRRIHDQAIDHALSTQTEFEIEYRAQLPDGNVRWFVGRGRCHMDQDGKCTRLLGVSADITERRQAQELFGLATEASPNGILLIDESGEIVLANAHIQELFGYRREQLTGMQMGTLVPGGLGVICATAADQDLIGRRKDGDEFPLEISIKSVRTPRGTLFLASISDISARKEAEEEALRRREELSRLSRLSLLGEMAASIAHEVNQPLSGILSNAAAGQLFIDRGNVDLNKMRDILVDVETDAHRAHDTIWNIRNTIKQGGTVRQLVDINAIVAQVTHMLQPDIAARSAKLDTSLEKNLPMVTADPVQIQQVLVNLLGNGLDAMRDTPLPERELQVATARNGEDTICVSVRDRGIGVAPEIRNRLFDQFFTTKEEGLGMGLSIVRSIVEAHAGKIEVDNENDGGARFSFTLPVA